MFTASKKGMEPPLQNLASPFPAILSAGAGGVADNWDCHPEHFRDIQFQGLGRKCVNKSIITHAIQLPPHLQPQGAELQHVCGAYDRTQCHSKKWENSPEKGDLQLQPLKA